MIIPIKNIILENEDPKKIESNQKSSFIKNAKSALKHPKYQKLLATNLASSAIGGVIGSVGGAALLKTIKPLTEDIDNPFPGSISNGSIPDAQKQPIPPRESILKSKVSQDLDFLKSIGRGAYSIGKGTVLYPYKAGRFISKHTPEMVGSAIRLGGLGYLGYAGLKALEEK